MIHKRKSFISLFIFKLVYTRSFCYYLYAFFPSFLLIDEVGIKTFKLKQVVDVWRNNSMEQLLP